jgi:hypothetical protein
VGTQLQIIQAVMDLVGAVGGIKEAPDYPPEQLNSFPFAVAFPSEGTHKIAVPGERMFLGNIILELHVSRVDLPNAVMESIGFGDTIPAALFAYSTSNTSPLNLPLKGTCDTFESIAQTFGELNWGDTQTLGYRFTITNIKARTNV